MKNFEFYNPTRIIFGKDTISKVSQHIPMDARVLMCYGGGSIKRNGVYDQVMAALAGWEVIEFGGIESNPDYETMKKAITMGKEKRIDFILAVGGGSVIDGAKLIAAGIPFKGDDLWQVVKGNVEIKRGESIPLGTVLTLPATGTEMNGISVISRRSTKEKFRWASEASFPVFSILDPTTTHSLPEIQLRNGIVDAYMHVVEQYMTYPVDARLQDRQAEGIFLTLHEVAQDAIASPPDDDARANLMWSATNALNNSLRIGVPTDFATHAIGHELTALYGLAHAESLAVVMPYLLWHQRNRKSEKLTQYAQRIWGLVGEDDAVIRMALDKLVGFFNALGMPTRLTDFDIDPGESASRIQERFTERGTVLGEHEAITPEDVAEILRMSR
jgi:NADP-dependent alcohol dehydrogenase